MNITGSFRTVCNQLSAGSGAFSVIDKAVNWNVGNNRQEQYQQANFQASRNWTGSTSSNGNHTHTVTVTVNKNTSIYGNSTTVQPASLKVRVKTRAK